MTVATAKSALIAGLEQELAKQEADIAGRTAFLNKDSPSVRVLRQSADALRSQIEQERAKIGTLQNPGQRELMSASLTEYEGLETEREFAQKSYEAATTAVESARMRAEQQSRYLATYVEPYLPEDSLYPARLQMVLLVLLCSTVAWAIGVLVFYGIRDHTA
jgi:capsular polysaccharide transport system permease protein